MVTLFVVLALAAAVLLWQIHRLLQRPAERKESEPESSSPEPSESEPEQDVPAPPPRPLRSTERDCVVAVHEAGHTIALWACTLVDRLMRVTVDNDGEGADGHCYFTSYDQKKDAGLWCSMVIDLAGAAAEVATYGKLFTADKHSDLTSARKSADTLASRGAEKPPWPDPTIAGGRQLPFRRMYTDPLSDTENALLEHGYRMARALMLAHRDAHSRLVGVLLYKRTLTDAEVMLVLGKRGFAVGNFVSSMLHKHELRAWFYLPAAGARSAGRDAS